ncbi:MAG: prephenate dehydrogenase/arogenate dehydrogenase family protein [Planctomycetes bacterium]|nr:prephenate dehydrogenase/arogenate dehydrogenase family protein [Planctomycetota bacterium]
MEDPLKGLRAEIEGLDRTILEAVSRRLQVARAVGEVKARQGLPIRDFATEKVVIERGRRIATELGLPVWLGERLAQLLIRGALKVQEDLQEASRGGTMRRIVVAGGAGRMGRWFARFFRGQGHDVTICDPRPSPDGFPNAPIASARDAEVVAVAAPLDDLPRLLDETLATGTEALVFDLASIKGPIATILRRAAAEGAKVTSLHPLFGPDVELLSGKRLLIARCGHDGAVREARALFEDTTLALVEVDIEEHDRLVGQVLGLSHAINILFAAALDRSGQPLARYLEAASTTFLRQASASAEVVAESPDLYHEIQHRNPLREEIYGAIEAALGDLRRRARNPEPAAFHRLLEDLARYFGDAFPRGEPPY